MPRFVLVCALAASGCFFDADYGDGRFTCSDGNCPSGLTCNADRRCVAATDDAGTTSPDAPTRSLTCSDPGPFPAPGGTTGGSTAARNNLVTAMCAGFVMNGNDAVYKVDVAAGAQLLVTVTGDFDISAYVLDPCDAAPATPMCLTNTRATEGNPLGLTTASARTHFIVVDATSPAASGSYMLTLDVN